MLLYSCLGVSHLLPHSKGGSKLPYANHKGRGLHQFQQCTKHRRAVPARSSEDEAPDIGDWRSFRQRLLSAERPEDQKGRESEMNMELLRTQDPTLASEGVWAHPTSTIEQGGILLATLVGPEALMEDHLEQAVILVLSHKPEGTLGLKLNRPTGQLLRNGKGGVRFPIANAPNRMQDTFADCRVYEGGRRAQNFFHMMHPWDLKGSIKIIDGVYMGGVEDAVEKVSTEQLPASSFKFFSGCVTWERKQVEREVAAGCWYTAACSRSLILKQCLQLPTPLWREILLLMGGKFLDVAREAYEGDEVSGE